MRAYSTCYLIHWQYRAIEDYGSFYIAVWYSSAGMNYLIIQIFKYMYLNVIISNFNFQIVLMYLLHN